MKCRINREYMLTEEEIREALLLFFKARDIPLPGADVSLSIKSERGQDLTGIEVSWSIGDEV